MFAFHNTIWQFDLCCSYAFVLMPLHNQRLNINQSDPESKPIRLSSNPGQNAFKWKNYKN